MAAVKKVLMIAFSYPPLAGMGMLRSLKFAKYLPAFGWRPVVLTIDASAVNTGASPYWACDATEGNLPDVKIIRTPYIPLDAPVKGLARIYPTRTRPAADGTDQTTVQAPSGRHRTKNLLMRFWNEWIPSTENALGWYPFAMKAALAYLRRNPADVIFSTALPMTSHLIASRLSGKTGIPWVADFRDPWSQGHYRKVRRLQTLIDQWLEVRIVKTAGALITVSDPLMESFLRLHRSFSGKYFVIPNGYDADDYAAPPPRPPRPMTITFTGRMYDIDFSTTGRTPEILFRSMVELFQEGRIPPDRLQCLIYGEYPRRLGDMISRYRLDDTVQCPSPVPFREAIRAQQQADILLLLSWNDADQQGILTGKIFEYLGAQKPILALPFPNRGIDDILQATQTGTTATTVEACKEMLCRWYRAFTEHGAIPYEGRPEIVARYSRQKGAEQLAAVLTQVAAKQERTC